MKRSRPATAGELSAFFASRPAPTTRSKGTVGTNPALRTVALPTVTGPGARRTRAKGTLAQKQGDGSGRMSDWAKPCFPGYGRAWQ